MKGEGPWEHRQALNDCKRSLEGSHKCRKVPGDKSTRLVEGQPHRVVSKSDKATRLVLRKKRRKVPSDKSTRSMLRKKRRKVPKSDKATRLVEGKQHREISKSDKATWLLEEEKRKGQLTNSTVVKGWRVFNNNKTTSQPLTSPSRPPSVSR